MSAQKPNNQQQPAQLYRGTVKSVVSGDCVIIKSLTSKDGKSLEKQVMLSSVTAPRLGRRINPTSPDSVIENDQPYAFEAREFLRKTSRQRGLFCQRRQFSNSRPRCALFRQRSDYWREYK